MPVYEIPLALTYDDVLLQPRFSTARSRRDVDTSACNTATVSNAANGWVQCRTVNQGVHPVMVAGVNAPCLTGTRYDYLQMSSALLVTDAGGRYAGAASKAADNVLCKGP